MGFIITPEISKKNKYWIPKYRYLELKYFCLQYPDWKREVDEINYILSKGANEIKTNSEWQDPTGDLAVRLSVLNSKISLVGKTAEKSDPEIGRYILKAVTEDLAFVRLKSVYEIPCERDMYYDRYRRFFWRLSRDRD